MSNHPVTPLRRLREARNITLVELAAALDMDDGTLSRIERGQGTSAKTAEKIARHFGEGITEMEILYPERFIPHEPEGGGHDAR